MRPHKLTLEGFTSFRDKIELDFTGLDLFAITGPTGAGKSSLIDAICFALYGQVPRVGDDYKQLISHGAERLSVHARVRRREGALPHRPHGPPRQALPAAPRAHHRGCSRAHRRPRQGDPDGGRPHPRPRLRRLHALGRPPAGPVRRLPEGRAQGAPQDPGRAPEPHRLRAHAAARQPEKLGREDRGRLHQAPARDRLRERDAGGPRAEAAGAEGRRSLREAGRSRPRRPRRGQPHRAAGPLTPQGPGQPGQGPRRRNRPPRESTSHPRRSRPGEEDSRRGARQAEGAGGRARLRRIPPHEASSPRSPSPTSSSASSRATRGPRKSSPTDDETSTKPGRPSCKRRRASRISRKPKPTPGRGRPPLEPRRRRRTATTPPWPSARASSPATPARSANRR